MALNASPHTAFLCTVLFTNLSVSHCQRSILNTVSLHVCMAPGMFPRWRRRLGLCCRSWRARSAAGGQTSEPRSRFLPGPFEPPPSSPLDWPEKARAAGRCNSLELLDCERGVFCSPPLKHLVKWDLKVWGVLAQGMLLFLV